MKVRVVRNLSLLGLLMLGLLHPPVAVRADTCGSCTCNSGQTCSTFACGFGYLKTCCGCSK